MPISSYDLIKHLIRKIDWSKKTFGPGLRTNGIVSHIRKELDEILENPKDLEEWIDVVILALDGAWRAGYTPEQIVVCLEKKTLKNMQRRWPDWRKLTEDDVTEHVK